MRVSVVVCLLALLGAAHNLGAQEPQAPQKDPSRISGFTSWHDGSTGGAYGIGEGWSLEILPPEYETFTEKMIVQEGLELVSIPATFEWVKEDSEAVKTFPKTVTKIVTIPAKYETVTKPEEVKPAKIEYFLVEPTYNSTGTLETPGAVKARQVPALIKDVSRRVIKTPARTKERVIPNVALLKRNGYVRLIKTPAKIIPRDVPDVTKTVTRRRVRHPQSFIVKQPDGKAAHIFDNLEALTAFVDSLK